MDAVEAAYREEYGQVVASLIRHTGDWELAEDSAQEALARAVERWPRDGVPEKPGAWLMTVARRYAVDRLRREAVGAQKQRIAVEMHESASGARSSDDRLELLFACCHPALPLESQVALTLRTLSGLSTAQIAAAFLVSEATMSRRLVRAKQKIREAGIPFHIPTQANMQARLSAVLGVLYLVFNEGYGGDGDLRAESLELTRMLDKLLPDQPEVLGLLALLLLHEARAASRGVDGESLIPLEEQDRSLWDLVLAETGSTTLDRALAFRRPGPYQVQAAIAAIHVDSESFAATDWEQIAVLYGLLGMMAPSPVVELNRAVAVAMAGSLTNALDMLAPLTSALDGFYLLPATRADILRRMGRNNEAQAQYELAIELAPNEPSRAYLHRRLAEVS